VSSRGTELGVGGLASQELSEQRLQLILTSDDDADVDGTQFKQQSEVI